MSEQKRGRGRPRNPVHVVSFKMAESDKRPGKQVQVKAYKLGANEVERTANSMTVRFSRSSAGSAVANFLRSLQANKAVSGISKQVVTE